MNKVPHDSDDERLDLVIDYFRTTRVPPCPSIEMSGAPSVVQPGRSLNYRNASVVCVLALVAIAVVGVFWVPNFVDDSSERDIAQIPPVMRQPNAPPERGNSTVLTDLPPGLLERSPVVEVSLDSDVDRAAVRRDISELVANLDRLAKRVALQDVRGRAQELVRSIQQLVASAK